MWCDQVLIHPDHLSPHLIIRRILEAQPGRAPSVAPAVSAKSRVIAHACGARVEWLRHNNSSTNIRNNNRNISNNKINEIALVAELKLCFT